MGESIIVGYEKVKNILGYFPSFHDSVIERMEISSEGVILAIDIKYIPKDKILYPKVKLIFNEIKNYHLEGEIYGCVSIILDMKFIKTDGYIETQISSSLGAYGTIRSNKVEIELE